MNNSPSAPPPSYDELTSENSEEFSNVPLQYDNSNEFTKQNSSEMELALQLQTNPYAYSQMCLNSTSFIPQSTTEIESIQVQPIVVQPKIIQGSGLLAKPDGSYDFGPYPCRVLCPECQKTSQTRIEYKNSGFTHILAGLICLFGCCCLAPLPYCINSCKNSEHHCGECGKYLGTFVNGYSVTKKHKKFRPRYINNKCFGPHNFNEPCGPHCHY